MKIRQHITVCTSICLFAAATTTLYAGGHTWYINEVFSNADGTVQFVELQECCGGNNEVMIFGRDVLSAQTGLSYIFPVNIGCINCTANAYLLLGTAGYAALPGAPAPDFMIPDNFFDKNGDTLTYSVYAPNTMVFGALVMDGLTSTQRDGSLTPNSPTNFAGVTGTVLARCHPADVDLSGQVDVLDLLDLLADWGPCGVPCSSNVVITDSVVDVLDLLELLAGWSMCP